MNQPKEKKHDIIQRYMKNIVQAEQIEWLKQINHT